MNTKGIKFLAVLAVLVMAFAAIAVVAPAETDDAGEAPTKAYKSPGSEELDTAAVVATLSDTTVLKYYAASTTSITATGSNANYIVYVLNATPNVELTITSVSDGTTVQVVPVTVSASDATQLVASSGITLKISSVSSSAVFTPTGAKTATLSGTATVSAMEVPAGTTLNSTATLTVGGASKVYGTLGLAGTTTIEAAITNTGTIAITGSYLVTLNNANAKITATETSHGKITTSGEKDNGQLAIAIGEISYQDITLKGASTTAKEEAITIGGSSGAAKLINNNIVQASAYGVYVNYSSGTEITVSNNVFTTTTSNLSYSIGMGASESATVGSSTKVTVTGNDFSGIPQSKYEDAYHTPVKINGSAGVVTTEATNGKVFVDKTGMRLGLRGAAITIEGDLTPAYLALNGTKVTLKASKTLTLNNDTYVNAGKEFEVEALAIVKNSANLYVNGTMTVKGGDSGCKVGVNGIIGTGTIVVGKAGTLDIQAVETISEKPVQTNTNALKLMKGSTFTGMTDTIFTWTTSVTAAADTDYVLATFNGSSSYTSAEAWPGFTYDINAYVSTAAAGVTSFGLAGDIFSVGSGYTFTIGGDLTIPADVTLNFLRGAKSSVTGTPTLTNNGIINYATYDQVRVTTGSGSFTVDGEEETVSTAATQDAIDAATTSVIIATEIKSITVPEGKVVVTSSTGTLENVTIAKAGSVLTFTSTDATNKVTVKNGTDATVTGYGSAVFAVNGTVTVSYGSVKIDGEDVYGTIEDITGKLTIEGDLAADQTLTLIASADTTLLVEDGKTLEIPEGSTLKLVSAANAKISMNNDGNITGAGTIDVNEYSQFYTSKPVSVKFTGDGTIIVDDATEIIRLNGVYTSQNSYTATQKVIINGNLTITKNSYIVIYGGLEVLEGVTVNIQDGGYLKLISKTAYAEIDGDIKSAALNGFEIDASVDGDIDIYGTITAAKGATDDIVTVKISGTAYLMGQMIVNSKAVAEFGELYIAETGSLEVNGKISGALYNEGKVLMNGGVSGTVTVYAAAAGAEVKIDALKTGTLNLSDNGMYLRTVSGVAEKVGDPAKYVANTMSFTNITGVTVTEDIYFYTYEGTQYVSNYTYLSGTATVADKKLVVDPTDYDPIITVTGGEVRVIDTLTVQQAYVNIAAGALKVTGSIYVENPTLDNADIGLRANSDLKVTGFVRSTTQELGLEAKISAVKYTSTESSILYYNYTNLSDAIASGAKDLTVLGNLEIAKDTVIPKGVDIDASGKTVTIDDEVTLLIENGGSLSAKTVNVDGTMAVENLDSGIICSDIVSDVSNLGEVDGLYTNVYVALNAAEAGDVVKITKKTGTVYIHRNVTVPEGVTLQVPASKTLGIVNNSTLTVNGLLENKGSVSAFAYNSDTKVYSAGTFAEEADTTHAAIAVNGFIESMTNMPYETYKIPGAYYTQKAMFCITSLPNSALVINDATGRTIDVYGSDMKYGTVEYVGTSISPVTVNVHDSVASGTIGIEYGTLNLDTGKNYDMTVAGPNGSVTFAGVKTTTAAVISSIDGDDDEETWMTAGVFAKNGNSKLTSKKTTFEGEFGVKNATIYAPTVKGDVLLSGNVAISDKSTVSGNLVVDNNATVAAAGDVTVTGTLIALEATGTKAAGTMAITGTLYVGGSSSSYETKVVTDADALVSGAVTATVSYIAFPGATASGAIEDVIDELIEDNKYTEFYVEEALFVTVFTVDDSAKIAYINDDGDLVYCFVPKALEDCEFNAWQYLSSGTLKTIEDEVAVGKSSTYTKVYALIDYDIYDIEVYTDAGIKAVSIDGVEMFNDTNNRFHALSKLEAGTHTISYSIKAGYQEDKNGVNLYTSDGIILQNLKFTVGGDAGITKLLLNGTELIPEPEPTPTPEPEKESEWNVTTILLLVLVILIAIMAVIVALRLNRS